MVTTNHRKLFDMSTKKNWKKIWTLKGKNLPLLLVILTGVVYAFAIDKGLLDAPEIIIKEVQVEVIKKEKVKVVKWIEHVKMPTEKFIMYLKPSLDPYVSKKIALAVNTYSKEYQLPKKLILSIIFKESSFDIFAKSKAGAIGLMQVMPKYHKDKINEMGITDNRKLYHIDNNIELGCKIWKTYYDMSKKDLDETFHRYLSKNASENTKNIYKNGILEIYARLDFLEFKYTNGNEDNK